MDEPREQIKAKAKPYIDFLHSKGLQSYVDELVHDGNDKDLYQWRIKYGDIDFWVADLCAGGAGNYHFKPIVYKCRWVKGKNGKLYFSEMAKRDSTEYAKYNIKDFEDFKDKINRVIMIIKTGVNKKRELIAAQDFV